MTQPGEKARRDHEATVMASSLSVCLRKWDVLCGSRQNEG